MSEKLALVTGASRGIGKACAVELAKAGYDIAVNYAGNVEAANKTVEELKALGVNAEAFKFDVSSQEAAAKGVEEVLAKFGRIDVLVNNAGITRDGLFMRMSAENWDAVINTNLSSAFYVSQPVVKVMMKQRSGAIVNMSSVVCVSGNAEQANYSAGKAGLIGLTKTLAKELGSRGIRVNAIAPGFINTDMTKDLDTSKFTDFIPLKRLGEPEDIAKAVKFLARIEGTYTVFMKKEIAKGKVQSLSPQQTLNLDMRISDAFNQAGQIARKKQIASAEAIKKRILKIFSKNIESKS